SRPSPPRLLPPTPHSAAPPARLGALLPGHCSGDSLDSSADLPQGGAPRSSRVRPGAGARLARPRRRPGGRLIWGIRAISQAFFQCLLPPAPGGAYSVITCLTGLVFFPTK